jgi:hypothetical protein
VGGGSGGRHFGTLKGRDGDVELRAFGGSHVDSEAAESGALASVGRITPALNGSVKA